MAGGADGLQYQLSDRARETALRCTRVMFPHDYLPDEAYEKVVRQLEVQGRGEEAVAATIEEGTAALDDPRRSPSSTPTRSSRP